MEQFQKTLAFLYRAVLYCTDLNPLNPRYFPHRLGLELETFLNVSHYVQRLFSRGVIKRSFFGYLLAVF